MQYNILCRAPDDERLDSLETCTADKKLWNKIDYKNCASRWSLMHCRQLCQLIQTVSEPLSVHHRGCFYLNPITRLNPKFFLNFLAVKVSGHANVSSPPPAEITGISLNLLKPTGHVMHQQFNIQQLYALPTLYLCVLYLS